MSFNRIVCMNYALSRCLCSCSLVCCRLFPFWSRHHIVCVAVFSMFSIMSVLSVDLSWYIAVATVLYNQMSEPFNQSQLLLLSPPQ